MPKKGVPAQEKIERILSILVDSKEFFQLKEIEKIASKQKGINPNLVKDIVNGLIADCLIDADKIGQSTYYWSFPSKTINVLEHEISMTTKHVAETETKLDAVNKRVADLRAQNVEDGERIIKLRELESLKEKRDQLALKYAAVSDCDPEQIDLNLKMCSELKDMANSWTDCLDLLKQWLSRKFGCEEGIINKQFDLPANLDYIAD